MLKDQSSDRAKREANKAFKPAETRKPMNDYTKAQHSFDENRERLKAERLAREAKPGSGSE
jgi:F0F1-type ATP synthase epsilon subunit